MKFPTLIILILALFGACQEPNTRRPINKKQQLFLNQSAQRNKARIAVEQELFEQIRKAEPEMVYQNSKKVSVCHDRKGKCHYPLPQKGQEVVLSYHIEDLNKNVLYDEKAWVMSAF